MRWIPAAMAIGGVAAAMIVSGRPAQGQDAQPATLQVTSRLVVLDVVVTDRNGKPVTDLDRSKFSVSEDNVPQTIKDFEQPSRHAMPPGSDRQPIVGSSADLPKIGAAPVDILVFDELNTPFHQLAYARQKMEAYLKALPEVLPAPTEFVAAGATRTAVLHDFTQSRAELLESVQRHTADLDFTQVMASLNGVGGGADNGMVKTLGALAQLAESVRGIPGRKNVIWVGTGYNRAYDLANLSFSDHDRVETAIQEVTDRMTAAQVSMYVIDPAGPAAANEATADRIDPTDESAIGGFSANNVRFDRLAYDSGGRVITGRNDLDAQVRQVTTEGTEYYTLSYVPTSKDDRARPYRRIHVTVSDPSLRVTTREGYFGGRPAISAVALERKAKQPADVKFDLLSAARTTMVYTGLHMNAQRTRQGYALLVNASDLKFEEQVDGTRLAEVTVVAVCYNAKNKELSQKAAELQEQLQAGDRIGPQSRVSFDFPLAVPAFTARVRFVMRDAGTAYLGTTDGKP